MTDSCGRSYLFIISDVFSGSSFDPFVVANPMEAVRTYTQYLHNQDSMLYKFPSHYTLNLIGYFDREEGEIEAYKLGGDLDDFYIVKHDNGLVQACTRSLAADYLRSNNVNPVDRGENEQN
ncbi:MAG: hypothetical protein [Microviridae sp.]|nr:MAG: hypothetical protein [Microviridae sp.]